MMEWFRQVLKIAAEDSPNVRAARKVLARNPNIDRRELLRLSSILAGVLSWEEYQHRRTTWDKARQTVGLDAEFYEGSELLLFPPEWLALARNAANELHGKQRRAEAIGIDPAEGGDKTAMAAVDRFGLIEMVSKKTPDTNVITSEALAFMRRHGAPAEKVVFDRGGGGKQHADRLRSQGWNVSTVAFGESLVPDPKRRGNVETLGVRLDQREDRYAYRNRRAEMYGELSLLLDPSLNPNGFGLPSEHAGPQYADLLRQLSVIRKEYDEEGRLMLPPKNRKPGQDQGKRKTLTELIGHSPDEADALVLAVYGMQRKVQRKVLQVF